MNNLIVSRTSVSALDPNNILVDSITLLINPFNSFSSNNDNYLSSVILTCFFINLTFDTNSYNTSSSSAWSIINFNFYSSSPNVFNYNSAISIALSISVKLDISFLHNSSIVILINCKAFFLTFIDWSLTLSIPAFINKIRNFFSTTLSIANWPRIPNTWDLQNELLSYILCNKVDINFYLDYLYIYSLYSPEKTNLNILAIISTIAFLNKYDSCFNNTIKHDKFV